MPPSSDQSIFIAYASEDRPWVEQFASALREAGVDPWFDVADLAPGEPFQDQLEAALRASRTLVLILTPNSIDNPWTLFELGAAIGDNKRIIPVVAREFDWKQAPLVLKRYQAMEAASPQEAGKRVAAAIQKAAA
jgi:hypothetical protein